MISNRFPKVLLTMAVVAAVFATIGGHIGWPNALPKVDAAVEFNDLVAYDGTELDSAFVQAQGDQSQITQYGITWSFDQEYPTGQFANGDYWVAGPVTITRITPDFDGTLNGWEVNPVNSPSQGFDSRGNGFDAGLVPSLPYVASSEQSIVKALSDPTGTSETCPKAPAHPCYLKTAAVLTILNEIPVDNGAAMFRPPYVGTDKKKYSVTSLRTDLLPSLAPVGSHVPTLDSVQRRFERVQLDHKSSWTTRYLHPSENLPGYGSVIAQGIVNGALRLMLNDPLPEKMPALIAYTQQGIDFYHMLQTGSDWHADGGHFVGRKLPIVFAAVLLGDDEMQSGIRAAHYTKFSEDNHTYYGVNGVALWGRPNGTEQQYWDRISQERGSRDWADPYGFVDGGGTEIGGAYQYCCTSQPYKGEALAALLLPEARSVWDHDAFFDYIDRWVTHGVWASLDPCAMVDPGTYSGNCVAGSGRFTEKHGTNADGGHYRSRFVDDMWDAYRATISEPTDPVMTSTPPAISVTASPTSIPPTSAPATATAQPTTVMPPSNQRPDASTTGYTGSLILYTGPSTITEDGTVLENFSYNGTLKIQANNVTLRNFLIDSGGFYGIDAKYDATGLLIEDGEIAHTQSAAVIGSNFTARRLHIRDQGADAFKPFGNAVIEENYVHNLGSIPGSHSDGVQMVAGNNVVIRGNHFAPSDGAEYHTSQVIIIQTNNDTVDNITIENNWLYDGGWAVQIRDKGNGFGPPTNVSITGNRFGDDHQFGAWVTNGEVMVACNVWDESGDLIEGQANCEVLQPTVEPTVEVTAQPTDPPPTTSTPATSTPGSSTIPDPTSTPEPTAAATGERIYMPMVIR